MSFLSKLFGGDKDAEKTARDLLKGLFGENAKKDDKPEEKPEEPAQENNTSAPAAIAHFAITSGNLALDTTSLLCSW